MELVASHQEIPHCGNLSRLAEKYPDITVVGEASDGAEAVRLVSGTIPLLFIAGCLEGFFSPSAAPVALKFSVGGGLFLLLLLWLFRPLPMLAAEPL